jgi:hypothetical protein
MPNPVVLDLEVTGGRYNWGAVRGITRGPVGQTNCDPAYLIWVPYVGPPQSFVAQSLTRDGDWTMVANKDTNDRPAPQQTDSEEDLLPAWTPAQASARLTYTVYNEWTINQSGWIDQYGIDVLSQNLNASHLMSLSVNGVAKDSFTMTPSAAATYWQNITPQVIVAGSVIRVTLQVTLLGNNLMYWEQQSGLFAAAPPYCSGAVGAKDGAAADPTGYGCHLLFIPGAVSPDWDVVSFGGSAGAGATRSLKRRLALLEAKYEELVKSKRSKR